MSEALPVTFQPDPIPAEDLEALAGEGVAPPWRIGSLGEADWAMGKYAEAAAEIARIDAHAAASRARIEQWRQQASARARRTLSFMEGRLIHYAASVRTERAKTLILPCGKVSSTAPRPHVEVTAEDEVVRWALETGRTDLLHIGPAKSELGRLTAKALEETEDEVVSALVTDDGEVVPGARLVCGLNPTYTVTPWAEPET